MRGESTFLSNNPKEWLTDVHLANAHAADERPEGNVPPVWYNYPRPTHLVPNIFSEGPAWRVLQKCDSALIQQFCDGLHWHNIVLVGKETRAYYWEPGGKPMGRRDAIRLAFETAAPPEWMLESIQVGLQADGHSCGDWAHYFRGRALAYVADDARLGTRTFPAFLVGDGMQDLRKVRSLDRKPAEQRQRRVARRLRDALRELLHSAARLGALPWGMVHIADFAASGKVQPAQFVDLDEEVDGDSKLNPINLSAALASAIAPVSAAYAGALASAASAASADVPVWLVLAPCDRSQQVRSVVHNHEALFTWGAATVLELYDNSGQQVRCVCVEGRWCAVDEQVSHTSAPSK